MVVTFRELKDWLTKKGHDLKTEGSFDYRSPLLAGGQYWLTRDFLARLVPGGESKRSRILAISGATRTLAFLKEVHDGSFRHGLSMVKYCTIENNSHGVGTDLTLFQRQDLQAKLLRVVDAGEIRRVGENTIRKVDVRLIATTNRNLEKAIEANRFREDLFYRLTTITIRLPPLRDRKEDVPLLARHLPQKACARVNKQVHGIADDAMEIIMAYHWPGNIRELENVIERAVVLAPLAGSLVLIKPKHLPGELRARSAYEDSVGLGATPDYRSMRDKSVGSVEKKLLVHYLKTADGNVTKACTMAGIPRRTFYRMMKRQGITSKNPC